MAWKSKLRAALAGGLVPDPAVVAKQDQCDLGKWLQEEAVKTYGSRPEYQELKSKHAEFHRIASNVLVLIQQKKLEEAGKEINSGEYAKASAAVVNALTALRKIAA